MKYKPLIGDQMSGSMGGVVASHNKGGTYFRQRAIPVNSNTSFQQAVRSVFTSLAAAWNGTLTQAQRDAWKVYADNTPVTDRIGATIVLPPMSMYIRSNTARLQMGLARVDAGPTTFGLPEFTPPTITSFSEATQDLTLAFTNTDDWAGAVGGAMSVLISRPVNPSKVYFKGPYRFADAILGAATPPTSPATIAAPFPFVEGQKLFLQARVTDVEGRLSGTFLGGIVAVA